MCQCDVRTRAGWLPVWMQPRTSSISETGGKNLLWVKPIFHSLPLFALRYFSEVHENRFKQCFYLEAAGVESEESLGYWSCTRAGSVINPGHADLLPGLVPDTMHMFNARQALANDHPRLTQEFRHHCVLLARVVVYYAKSEVDFSLSSSTGGDTYGQMTSFQGLKIFLCCLKVVASQCE